MGQSPVAKIYIEKRSGNTVTVIAGLHTYGTARLEEMARALKLSLGTGGTVKEGKIEIQGDKAALIRSWFKNKKSNS